MYYWQHATAHPLSAFKLRPDRQLSLLTMLRGAAATVVIAAVAVGCTRIRATTFDPQAASAVRRSDPSLIRFYEVQRPRCSFREVGHITASEWVFSSWDKVVQDTRKRASQMGGDAIISVRESTRIAAADVSTSGVSIRESTSLSGTVIRFTYSNCRE